MSRIAHLGDVHVVSRDHAGRRNSARARLAALALPLGQTLRKRVTFGSSPFGQAPQIDQAAQRRRAARAFDAASRSGVDHVVAFLDLVEDGTDTESEILAGVLAGSGLRPSQITLVAKSRSVRGATSAFTRALEGPLRAYAATSTPGTPIALRDAVILPVSAAMVEPLTRSSGAIDDAAIDAVARFADETRVSGRALVIAMHDPPPRLFPVVPWLEGAREHASMNALLERYDHIHVLHERTDVADRAIRPGAAPRIHAPRSAHEGAEPRIYKARHARLWPASNAEWGAGVLAMA